MIFTRAAVFNCLHILVYYRTGDTPPPKKKNQNKKKPTNNPPPPPPKKNQNKNKNQKNQCSNIFKLYNNTEVSIQF